MNRIEKAVQAVDALQQRHAWLAFPVAVWKKFGDDQAYNLAALIAYSALVAIFPLLLVLVTVLDIVLKNDPELKQKVLNAVDNYPGISLLGAHRHFEPGRDRARDRPGRDVHRTLGIANLLQNALNSVWEIPSPCRPWVPVVVAAQYHLDRRRRHGLHRHHDLVRAAACR